MRRVFTLVLLVTLAACAENPVEMSGTDDLDGPTTMIGIPGGPSPLSVSSATEPADASTTILELEVVCGRTLTGIAYDGSHYYVAEGGSEDMCVGRFDGRTGELVDYKKFPPDFRGLHYTPATGLVGRTYGGVGGELYAIDYEAGTATPITSFDAVSSDRQSQPAVDPDGTTYWMRAGSNVIRRDLSDGSGISAFDVVPLPVRVNGLAVTNDGILVPNDMSVEIYDRSGTHLASQPMTASTFGCSGFGFGSSLSGDRIMYAVDCSRARVEVYSTVIIVDIDVKPNSDANRINRRARARLPVAVLSDAEFDAATVDPSSVVFGPAEATPVRGGMMKDVDADGDLDRLFYFETRDTGLGCGETEATLSGLTTGGDEIEGTDSVQMVCRGNRR